MRTTTQITYRNLQPSDAVTERLKIEAAKLEHFYDRITNCRILVEAPHRHQKWGEPFHVRVELGVPGGEIVVGHEPGVYPKSRGVRAEGRQRKALETNRPHKDIYIAIHDTFRAVRRRLQSHVDRLRHDVKDHEQNRIAA